MRLMHASIYNHCSIGHCHMWHCTQRHEHSESVTTRVCSSGTAYSHLFRCPINHNLTWTWTHVKQLLKCSEFPVQPIAASTEECFSPVTISIRPFIYCKPWNGTFSLITACPMIFIDMSVGVTTVSKQMRSLLGEGWGSNKWLACEIGNICHWLIWF